MWRMLLVLLACLPGLASADDRLVRLHAPPALEESGLLTFALPRFTLKTQVRVERVPTPDAADLSLGEAGRTVFAGLGQDWRMELRDPGHAGAVKLAEWLISEVGQRTIAGYQLDGVMPFGPPEVTAEAEVAVPVSAAAEMGHRVSREKCTRCHAVDEATRGWGIGSTPSFAVLRAMPDWEARFAAFYALAPHPAFTQIADLTEPFPIDRPSPIAPIELDFDELDALLAYVEALAAADLGAPLVHQ